MRVSSSGLVSKIVSWKKEYGSVYYVKIGYGEYIYRSMTREEHMTLLNLQGKMPFDLEDTILKACLLSPLFNKKTFDRKLAGEIDYLVQCIANSSGFSGTDKIEEDINEYRNRLGNLDNQIAILICKAFPHLTLSDINNFTYDELLRYLAISEAVLDVKLNIEKPKPQQGSVDFAAENRAMGAVPFDKNLNIPRGDVRK